MGARRGYMLVAPRLPRKDTMDYSKTKHPPEFWEKIHEHAGGAQSENNAAIMEQEDGSFAVCVSSKGRIVEEFFVDAEGNKFDG